MRACVNSLWLLASVGVLVFMCCVCVHVWVHTRLGERPVLENVGLVFRDIQTKWRVANPRVCGVYTLFNV